MIKTVDEITSWSELDKSVNEGGWVAQFEAGKRCYSSPEPGHDRDQAASYFELATNNQDATPYQQAHARLCLSYCYLHGLGGVTKNEVTARTHLILIAVSLFEKDPLHIVKNAESLLRQIYHPYRIFAAELNGATTYLAPDFPLPDRTGCAVINRPANG